MNRTIKEATVKRYYYQSHDHLKQHLHTFLMAYNFAKRLKTLKGDGTPIIDVKPILSGDISQRRATDRP